MICLNDYKKLEEEITYLEYKLERKNFELKRQINCDLGNVKMKEAVKQVKQELLLKKQKLQMLIDLMSKFEGVENKILKMKYRDGMTLDAIGSELNYNPDYIKHKHAEMMKRIKFAKVLESIYKKYPPHLNNK
ncbi:transcriptional regulator [Bacillus cereus]|uniref:transcriptional regulator n=1 Tax=Bacillus wiedmannii TaxID=1890302 RepID=UPI000BF749F7|nr:transcriptional regulator [Bacillus wiedmannii]PGA80829.1 transcriptional regulator [Bacillus wiedmannii]PGM39149.1 transcriptional regulator [Bacillus cereus]